MRFIPPANLRRAAILVATLWVVAGTIGTIPDWAGDPSQAIQQSRWEYTGNCDVALIYQGIRETPTLRDTLKWWHSVWAGQVPFWRPLTSLAFWLEYHAFGPDRLDGWVWVSAALHLVATGLAALLAARLTGRWWTGPVVAVLFGTQALSYSIYGPEGQWPVPMYSVITEPALQQELWMALPVLGAMLAAISRKWLPALLLCGLAVSAKEMGWTAFPLCLLAVGLVHGWGSLRAIPRWVWAAGVALVALLLVARWSAGPEVFRGFRMGTNANWSTRLLNIAGGRWLNTLAGQTWTPGLWAGIAFAAWVPWGRRGRGSLLAAAVALGLAAATCAQMVSWRVTWDVALTQLLTVPLHVCDAVSSFVSLCVLWAYFGEREERGARLAVFAMYLLTTLPFLAATQVQAHALYLERVFVATTIPLAAVALHRCLQSRSGVRATVSPK